jgi:hypothetical protein
MVSTAVTDLKTNRTGRLGKNGNPAIRDNLEGHSRQRPRRPTIIISPLDSDGPYFDGLVACR